MRKAVLFLVLVCVLGNIAVVGQLSGRVDFSFAIDPFVSPYGVGSTPVGITTKDITPASGGLIDAPLILLTLEYGFGDWTLGMLTTFSFYGLTETLFGARGALGALQFSSYMVFGNWLGGIFYGAPGYVILDGTPGYALLGPSFSEWWNLGWMSIAGTDVWIMAGVARPYQSDHVVFSAMSLAPKDCCTPSADGSFGLTLGLHGVTGDLEVWAEADFGGGHIVDEMAYWGLGLAEIANSWYECWWGNIHGSCNVGFSDVVVYVKSPFVCGTLLTTLEIDCDGFDYLRITMNDLRFGIDWLYIDEFAIEFATESKDVDLYLAATSHEALCIEPHFLLEVGEQYAVEGLMLGSLTLEYSWNGMTFVAIEKFDTQHTAYPDYAITLDARLFELTFDKSLCSQWDVCLAPPNVDEAFGLEFNSDACCGSGMSGGVYVFFDTGQEGTSLFDWAATRAVVTLGVGSNFESSVSAMFFADGYQRYTFRFAFTWGELKIFDHQPSRCDLWYLTAT